MPDYQQMSTSLRDALGLAMSPIAVSLTQEVPTGVPAYRGRAPAGCSFWEQAATGAFATSTADHELCAIGVHTHNLAGASEQAQSELGQVLKVMADMSYVRESDVAAIPVLERKAQHVVYAPLAEAPVAPDAVLLFVSSAQGLIVAEAAGQVDDGIPPALGRPACALVPQVINSGRAALSLGCCGARAYLDALTDDVALWGLPGAKLEAYAERISALTSANQTLAKFHQLRRADVEAGKTPTLEQSLGRLSE